MLEDHEKKPISQSKISQSKEVKPFTFQVPQCCREGWESCPHVAKKIKKQKTNIGL